MIGTEREADKSYIVFQGKRILSVDDNGAIALDPSVRLPQLRLKSTMIEPTFLSDTVIEGNLWMEGSGIARIKRVVASETTTQLIVETGHGLKGNDLIRARAFYYDAAANRLTRYDVTATVQSVAASGDLTVTNVSSITDLVKYQKGMEFVRIGNTTDVTRQSAIQMRTDTTSPRLTVYGGVNSVAALDDISKMRVVFGGLDGLTDPDFGALAGFGMYAQDNIYLKGALITKAGSIVDGGYLIDSTVVSKKITAASRGMTTDIFFSSVNDATVQWTAGHIKLAGTTGAGYPISAGQVGGLTTTTTYLYCNFAGGIMATTDQSVATSEESVVLCLVRSAMTAGAGVVIIPTAGIADIASTSWIHATYASFDYVNTSFIYVGGAAGDVNSGVTTINGGKITTGTIALSQLNFTPVQTSDVVAKINASAEGLTIDAARLNLTGVLAVGGAAGDVNSGVTTINGGKITAGTITSLGAVTAGTFNLGSGKFSVDVNGYLMATGVNISGTITDSTLTTGSGYPYEVNVGHGTITFTEIATGVTGTVAFGSNLDLSTSNVNYKVTVGGNEIWHAGNDPLGKGGTISFTDANADNWAITFSKGRCTSAKKNGTEQLT